jgi:hypothetical protein
LRPCRLCFRWALSLVAVATGSTAAEATEESSIGLAQRASTVSRRRVEGKADMIHRCQYRRPGSCYVRNVRTRLGTARPCPRTTWLSPLKSSKPSSRRTPSPKTPPSSRRSARYGYWRERLSCVASFPLDGVEIVAKQTEGQWQVGLVSGDREVAWELRGLRDGLEAWREASKAEDAPERAKREAFGEVTVARVVDALNTFLGTSYASDFQASLDAAYAHALQQVQADSASVEAARAAASPMEFATVFKGPFHSAMTTLRRDREFLTFAYCCAGSRPEYSDIVVRAAVTEAWAALRA